MDVRGLITLVCKRGGILTRREITNFMNLFLTLCSRGTIQEWMLDFKAHNGCKLQNETN